MKEDESNKMKEVEKSIPQLFIQTQKGMNVVVELTWPIPCLGTPMRSAKQARKRTG